MGQEELCKTIFESINITTNTVYAPKQLMTPIAKIYENSPILGRTALLVKDDVLLADVDEAASGDALDFSYLGIQPEPMDALLGKVSRRFRKDALRETDAGMQI